MALLSACSRGCGHDHPYTPYVMDSSPVQPAGPRPAAFFPDAGAAGVGAGLGSDAGSFVHVVAQRPDTPGGGFLIDGATPISPPPGTTFLLALAVDLDGDNTRDAVAWATESDPLAGRLVFYKGNAGGAPAEARNLAVLAPGVLGSPGCAPEPALEQIGPHTVAVSIHAACPAPQANKRLRWVAVATPLFEPALREELFLGDPPQGERLDLTLDSSDLDGDHRDDLALHLAIEGAPLPFESGGRAVADLRWLDRPTGLSRDAEEPEASLRRAASLLWARSAKKSDAPSVAAAARQIERLYAWLCADGGDPLLTSSSGALKCGPSRALEDASLATARAALTLGNVARAVSAFDRLGWRPVTTSKARRTEIEKAILKAAPTRTPAVVRVLATVPDLEGGVGPGWSPLTFTPGGGLLIRTKGGLATVDMATGVETPAQGIPSWPAAVTNPEGTTRWLALYDPCDGVSLRARVGAANEVPFLVPPAGAPPAGGDLPVPVSPPIPARCFPGAPNPRLDGVPVAWASAGIEAWMAGEPVAISADLANARAIADVGTLGQPVHAGSPRSPNERATVQGTKLGALVHASSWQLWRPADREGAYGYGDLRYCAVANDAHVVACIRDGRVVGMSIP